MPEGDTVWRTARALHRALTGHVLVRAELRVPQHATADLVGATVTGTHARGKHLVTRLERPGAEQWTLHTHLKMEGSWHLYPTGGRWRRPDHQVRAVLGTADTTAVGFSLGVVELVPRSAEADLVAHLGPDLLGPDWDEDEALRRLRAEPARTLADALLDQRVLAGIGNMYLAELCFVTGHHPGATVGSVADLPRLVRTARRMLALGTRHAVQATTGDQRPGQRTWVYRRDGEPCRRCGATVQVAMRGPLGRERASYWCPRCQPGP